MKEREIKIQKSRQSQPIEELERKWEKSKGRWSNQFWAAEWLDLCAAKAKKYTFKLD